MSIQELLDKIKSRNDCIVNPPEALPKISNEHVIPDDIKEFYRLCGGVTLFEGSAYSLRIVSPKEMVLANPVILPAEVIENETANGTYETEMSNDWYIISDLYNSDYIVIDLHSSRGGRCYKAFWDTYPSVGETPIIARSFSELLQRLLINSGEYWYFLSDDFLSWGDAYDESE